MKEARVGIFEDGDMMRGLIRAVVESEGHRVVHESSSLEESMLAIQAFKSGDMDVATVDGNLGLGMLDCSDGIKVVEALKRVGGITVISFAGCDSIKGADLALLKCGQDQLGKLLGLIRDI